MSRRTYDPSKVAVTFSGAKFEGFSDIAIDDETGDVRPARAFDHGMSKYGRGPWMFDLDEGVPYPSTGGSVSLTLTQLGPAWHFDVMIFLCDPHVHAFLTRSPWRVIQDLHTAELVYRDACEEGRRTADEVTALLAICNDLRDELELVEAPTRHPRDAGHNHRHGIQMVTTAAADVPWSFDIAGAEIRSALNRQLRRLVFGEPKVTYARIDREIRDVLVAHGLEPLDVHVEMPVHDELRITYSARRAGAIHQVNLRTVVEI